MYTLKLTQTVHTRSYDSIYWWFRWRDILVSKKIKKSTWKSPVSCLFFFFLFSPSLLFSLFSLPFFWLAPGGIGKRGSGRARQQSDGGLRAEQIAGEHGSGAEAAERWRAAGGAGGGGEAAERLRQCGNNGIRSPCVLILVRLNCSINNTPMHAFHHDRTTPKPS